MKNWQKYLLALIIFFITCITLTFLINNDIVNASFSNDPKLMDEEVIIIDNTNKNSSATENNSQIKKQNNKSKKFNVNIIGKVGKKDKQKIKENNEV